MQFPFKRKNSRVFEPKQDFGEFSAGWLVSLPRDAYTKLQNQKQAKLQNQNQK